MTGYFGRPSISGKQSGKWTKVHITCNGKPLCGYRPHKTMSFQWNSSGINLGYTECDKCKELGREILLKDNEDQHKKIKAA